MRVAFVASEVIPYAKTGGLADVAGALPKHLAQLGLEVSIFMPFYKGIKAEQYDSFSMRMDKDVQVDVYTKDNVFFIDHPGFFDRPGLYGDEKGDYADNCERFTLFCRAVVHMLENSHYDIVHCHDWQTGLIPLLLHAKARSEKCVFTIHNLGYQGRFPKTAFKLLGVDTAYFTPEGIEYHDDINLLKSGIVYSHKITTVSRTYAREIQTSEYGFGLDGILRTRTQDIVGIINGIDYEVWDPGSDPCLIDRYQGPSGKSKNKAALLNACGLFTDRPLIGMVTRIAEQKGFDILMEAFEAILNQQLSMVILGIGDETLHEKLKCYQQRYPKTLSVHLKFDNTLAHRIYAASDFFLMPSRYEPCGLGQLISLRYGTVPIVRFTGGLADTITEYEPDTAKGNGFGFTKYSDQALLSAIIRALDIYNDQDAFSALSESCMKMDYSWQASARKYAALYKKLV